MTKAGEIVFKLRVNSKEYTSGLNRAKKEMENFSMTTRMLGISIQRAGAAVSQGAMAIGKVMTGISAAIVGAGAVAVKMASDWESAFVEVSKVVDPAKTNVKSLEKGLLDMSKRVPLATEELAAVAASAGRLGIEGEKNILKFTEVVSAMGVTTNLSAEEAGDAMARFANITGMPINKVDRLGSTIVNLGNNLPTTEKEITNLGLRIASAGRASGLSEADMMSFAGAITATGISAERGGSNFSLFLRTLDTATKDGGKKLNTFAKVAGMTADEFKKKYKKDAAGAVVDFLKGLNKMEKDGISTAGVYKDLGINGMIMHEVLGNLSGNIKLVEEALKYGNDGWDRNTALMDEAAQRYNTFASLVQLVQNRFKYLAIIIGGEIMRVLAKFLLALFPMFDALDKLVDWFAELDESVKDVVIYIGMAIAAVTSLAALFSFLVAGVASVISVFGLFLAGASAVGLTLGGLVAISLSVVGVIALIAAGVMAAVGTFAIMIARSEKMRDAVVKAFNGMKERVKIIVDELQSFASKIWKRVVKFWEEDIGEFVDRLGEILEPVFAKLRELGEAQGIKDFATATEEFFTKAEEKFESFLEAVNKVLEYILIFAEFSINAYEKITNAIDFLKEATGPLREAFGETASVMGGQFAETWERVKTLIESLTPIIVAIGILIGGILLAAFVALTSIINGVLRVILPLINAFLSLLDVFTNVVMSMVALIHGDWDEALEYWDRAVESSINFFKDIWDALVGFFTGIVDALIGWFHFLDEAAGGILTDFVNNSYNKFIELKDKAIEKVTEFVKGVSDGFSEAATAMSNYVEEGKKAVIEKAGEIVENTVKFFSELPGKIGELASSFYEAGANILSSLGEGISDAFGKVTQPISDLAEKIRGFFPFSPAKEGALTDIHQIDFGGTIGDAVKSSQAAVVASMNNMTKAMKLVLTNFLKGLGGMFKDGFGSIGTAVSASMVKLNSTMASSFKKIGSTTKTALSGVGKTVSSSFKSIGSSVKSSMSSVASTIKSSFSSINSVTRSATNAMSNSMRASFNAIGRNVKSSMTSVSNTIRTSFTAINRNAKASLTSINSSMRSSFTRMVSTTRSSMTSIRTVMSSVWTSISANTRGKINSMVSSSTSRLRGFSSSIRSSFISVRAAVVSGMNSAVSAANSRMAGFASAGRRVGSSVASGIRSSMGAVRSAAGSMASTIRRFLPFSPAKEGALKDIMKVRIGESVASAIKRGTPSAIAAMKDMTDGINDLLIVDSKKVQKGLEGTFKNIDSGIKVTYDTPEGTNSTVSSVVKSMVEVIDRDGMIVEAIEELADRINGIEIVMNERVVGEMIAPHVEATNNRVDGRNSRFGGGR